MKNMTIALKHIQISVDIDLRKQHPHIGHRQGGQKAGEQQKGIHEEVGQQLGHHQLVGDKQGGQQQIRHSEGDIDINQEGGEHS